MNESENPKTHGVLVVGIDGSAGASEALRWATDEARLRNSRLLVVHAWRLGYLAGPGGGYGYVGGPFDPYAAGGLGDRQEAAEEFLEEATRGLETEGVEIERRVVEGSPAEALVQAAAEGDLLVVGSRGHGGFAGLLLGSVSQQCAHHAPCPVVIVHAAKPGSGGSGPVEAAVAESQKMA
jgi:nucleotide-binding universal stress UspA family protein